MTDWLSHLVSLVYGTPPQLPQLTNVLVRRRASTEFLIKNSETLPQLYTTISDRLDHILVDNVCVAYARIQASTLLLHDICQALRRLATQTESLHLESSALLVQARGLVVSRLPLFGAEVRAEQCVDDAKVLSELQEALHAFVGLHSETISDIKTALCPLRAGALSLSVIDASRQVSSFIDAVCVSIDVSALVKRLLELVRTALQSRQSDSSPNPADAAKQLDRFWRQDTAPPTVESLDIGPTAQILLSELMSIPRMQRNLNRVTSRYGAPAWDFQRRPVRYTVLATASSSAARYAFLNSRSLGGTGLLEENAATFVTILHNFLKNNLYHPAYKLYEQVFHESPTTASEESIAEARSSLRQMLIDFTDKNLSQIDGAQDLARNGSMKAVMNAITEQAGHPLRNSIAGSLGQAVLLQVQKLKCDVEELMLKTRQLLRAQELNLALVALVPAFITAACATYMLTTSVSYWRGRNAHLILSAGQTAKFMLCDVHEALLALEHGIGDESNLDGVFHAVEQIGRVHYNIFALEDLTRTGLTGMPPELTVRFENELKVLRNNRVPMERRRRQAERMLQCYPIFQDG